jgi:hypothetical protein
VGLAAPPEVVEWFHWAEPDRAAWSRAGAIGDPELFWAAYPMTTDEAVRTYRQYEERHRAFADTSGGEEEWRSTWFPILWSSPALYVADCTDPSLNATPVRRVENGPSDGPAAPVIFPSITDLIRAATRQVRSFLSWDGESIQPRQHLVRIEET